MAASDHPDGSKLLQTQRIIWAAELTTSLLLLGMLRYLQQQGAVTATPTPSLLPALGLAAVVVAVVSLILPGRLLATALRRAKLATEERAVDAPQLFRQAPRTRRVFAKPAAARARALQASQAPLILALALGQAVSILGFTLGMTGVPMPLPLPFFAVGSALIAWRFPRQQPVMRTLEKCYSAALDPTQRAGDRQGAR